MVLKIILACLSVFDYIAEILLTGLLLIAVTLTLIVTIPFPDETSDRAVALVLRVYFDAIPCPLVSGLLRRVLCGPRRRPDGPDPGRRRAC